MNGKQGLNKGSASDSMSKWSLPSPDSIKPETQPAKPGGSGGAGAYANKHANTQGHSASSSNASSLVSSIKSRY